MSHHSASGLPACCINRSQLSYGLTGLALIRADGAQPSLHLDEYVFVPYIYGLVALLESTIKASSNQYFNTAAGRASSSEARTLRTTSRAFSKP